MDSFASSDIARSEWLTHLMNEYGDRLTKLAYTYVKDVGKAQEIVQDVFVTCYEQYEKVRQIEKIKPWLYRVTINRAKDVLRSNWVKRVLLHNTLANDQITSNLTEEMILQNDEQTTLFHMILALPVKYREVILLFYYEDCSIDDIAKTLKINPNTIKTRLKRGRSLLEKHWKELDEDGR